MAAEHVPDARQDGLCVVCTERKVVTFDGRLCKKCLAEHIRATLPGYIRYKPTHRSQDQRQDWVYDEDAFGRADRYGDHD